MRFAYIDSQGKEVGIPSVEALQLRIELGAITEETIFYDASKDRWDPAGEHEIFRTLSREIRERGEEGPRPPTPRVVSSDDGAESEGPGEGSDSATLPYVGDQDPLADTAPPAEVDWVEVELEDVHEPDEAPASAPDSGGDWDVDLGEFGSLDLAPDLEAEEGGDREPRSTATTADGEPGSRFAGGAVASSDGGDEVPKAAEDPEGTAGASGELMDEEDAARELEGVADDLELEKPLAEEGDASSGVASDPDLELETPLSRLEPGPQGDWGDMEEDPTAPGVGAGTEDSSETLQLEGVEAAFATPSAVGGETPGAPGPGKRAPTAGRDEGMERVRAERRRRDPYDRRRQRPGGEGASRRRSRPLPRRRGGPSPGLIAAGVAGLIVLGGLGWLGWSTLQAPEPTAGTDRVVIPPLPEGLAQAMRTVADSAWGDALDTLRAMAERSGLPDEPNPDWLAGVYLANAGDYPDVPAYWSALGDHLDRVRAADERAFVNALEARLDSSTVPVASRDTVLARARAGFLVAAPERQVIYDQLAELIAAAMELHGFLVANQAQIAYEPAVGLSSRDPVTEAIPATQALGDEMWERVGEIPAALEALGTLDRVTTPRILEVFHRRLASVGIP